MSVREWMQRTELSRSALRLRSVGRSQLVVGSTIEIAAERFCDTDWRTDGALTADMPHSPRCAVRRT